MVMDEVWVWSWMRWGVVRPEKPGLPCPQCYVFEFTSVWMVAVRMKS